MSALDNDCDVDAAKHGWAPISALPLLACGVAPTMANPGSLSFSCQLHTHIDAPCAQH